jgi:hypothetical protein
MTFADILKEGVEELEQHKMSKEQLDKYNASMEKNLVDKLFFMDHIPHYDLLVDYGCANGALIKAAYPYNQDALHIGYDISKQMLSEAEANVGQKDNVIFTDNWDEVTEHIADKPVSLLTMNSVLHEVFSYSNSSQYRKFWSQAFRSGFTFVSIRDMMMRKKDFEHNMEFDEIDEIKKKLLTLDHGEEKIESFEDKYGEIISEGQLIHLLLKWHFWNNWQREVNENYLGITTEDFFKKVNSAGGKHYDIAYWQPFVLRYLQNWVEEQVDYKISSPTHIKMLLRKK